MAARALHSHRLALPPAVDTVATSAGLPRLQDPEAAATVEAQLMLIQPHILLDHSAPLLALQTLEANRVAVVAGKKTGSFLVNLEINLFFFLQILGLLRNLTPNKNVFKFSDM